MTAAEVLRNAAKIIRERGWVQHAYTSGDGKVCAAEAIRVGAEGHGDIRESAHHALLRAIKQEKHATVSGWTNRSGQASERVCAKLEEIAEELEG